MDKTWHEVRKIILVRDKFDHLMLRLSLPFTLSPEGRYLQQYQLTSNAALCGLNRKSGWVRVDPTVYPIPRGGVSSSGNPITLHSFNRFAKLVACSRPSRVCSSDCRINSNWSVSSVKSFLSHLDRWLSSQIG